MRRFTIVLVILALFAPVSGQSRRRSTPQPASDSGASDGQFQGQRNNRPEPEEVRVQKEMEKGLNKERYKNLKKDTDELLELATKLKQHVDKAGENVLSLEVVKKAEEIEKLSKKVRERMLENYKTIDRP